MLNLEAWHNQLEHRRSIKVRTRYPKLVKIISRPAGTHPPGLPLQLPLNVAANFEVTPHITLALFKNIRGSPWSQKLGTSTPKRNETTI